MALGAAGFALGLSPAHAQYGQVPCGYGLYGGYHCAGAAFPQQYYQSCSSCCNSCANRGFFAQVYQSPCGYAQSPCAPAYYQQPAYYQPQPYYQPPVYQPPVYQPQPMYYQDDVVVRPRWYPRRYAPAYRVAHPQFRRYHRPQCAHINGRWVCRSNG